MVKLQEHEYKARDKTVQKMSRDGLREENLRNKEEKSRATREFFIEKTGKTTPGYYRQVLKITTEISVLAKEKG